MKFTNNRIVRILSLVLMICAAASGLMSQTTAALKEIALQKEGNRLSVQFKIEGTYAVEASFLPAPPRLVVDLTPMAQIQVLPYTQINDIGVLDIRTGQYTPETTRIVFDLSSNVPAYNIVQNAEGLKVSFWYEGEVPPLEA
ncbi:MAG: AMIN domain-containing protein, partial [Candidatus Aminicenantes bacterium]|nr:AMIN domain-containing protein [Candidatus Aminicenantes bacterium]